MPYTSPSSRSPISSSLSSPSSSRRSSVHLGISGAVRSDLPRSASYLARHRRTGSVQDSIGYNFKHSSYKNNSNDEMPYQGNLKIPQNFVIDNHQKENDLKVSPSDLNSASCDENESLNLQNNSNRCKSWNFNHQKTNTARDEQDLQLSPKSKVNQKTKKTAILDNKCSDTKLNVEIREKQNVATTKFYNHSYNQPIISKESPMLSGDDSSSDDDETPKPSMVRKKSGELVRPALRPPIARRRPSSMPGTPTYSKAVHFDSHLEHIRHFLQVDRPLAVSAGSSPVPNYDSDNEFPFGEEYLREPPYEWELVISKFPLETPERLAQAVRVERVFLSNDNKILVGSIIVANLAYKKSVVVRFTLDYWKTTSEVVAEFNQDSRQPIREGYDRFNFNIKLSDLANLDAKTMFFCVKYSVNGGEYWDNNNYKNFQLDFRKKVKAKAANMTRLSSSSLPHSTRRSTFSRPKSMPPSFEDYTDEFDRKSQFIDFQNPIEDYLGESRFSRRKGSGSKKSLALDTQLQNIGQPNGNAFGNRYDFEASLSAVINASNTPKRDQELITSETSDVKTPHIDEQYSPLSDKPPVISQTDLSAETSTQAIEMKRPSLSSQSYNDLLDKYCFFGSTKTSPQLRDANLKQNRINSNDQFGYLYNFVVNTFVLST
ncbi:putative protein phosphatase regulator [Erysiphe necator]|uniref:CBM21 domain-containing protein n=1 Tax=Uncinula necator TaxID=52586 RepID=A0A0B1NYJ4_UNCNE|nr:putative protein phosphatase regulator [Erysiphe necator]